MFTKKFWGIAAFTIGFIGVLISSWWIDEMPSVFVLPSWIKIFIGIGMGTSYVQLAQLVRWVMR